MKCWPSADTAGVLANDTFLSFHDMENFAVAVTPKTDFPRQHFFGARP